ncbi:hypothetical protein HanXRQr2_Chr13g0581121 [Helianthus annuus]|uniref:Uncharacterized protein n=1 Tax=Helianthus annuus TaxID=4232 RepID=A0A9K3EF80_HELAN|nr:hypothetical protein HanXRQr2_Chr13g0581121 [Helianthus annuus]KAJ0848597.1 hypothetical protein HanPSC8_Chr13g0559371 [Helianthus annuus]
MVFWLLLLNLKIIKALHVERLPGKGWASRATVADQNLREVRNFKKVIYKF